TQKFNPKQFDKVPEDILPFFAFYPYRWQLQEQAVPHPKPERAASIQPISNIEAVFVPPVIIRFGWEPTPLVSRSVVVDTANRNDLDVPFVGFQAHDWEVAPYQPQHVKIQKQAAEV